MNPDVGSRIGNEDCGAVSKAVLNLASNVREDIIVDVDVVIFDASPPGFSTPNSDTKAFVLEVGL